MKNRNLGYQWKQVNRIHIRTTLISNIESRWCPLRPWPKSNACVHILSMKFKHFQGQGIYLGPLGQIWLSTSRLIKKQNVELKCATTKTCTYKMN